ncbi:MAG TPA: Rrf2 family transcriptional regulator [Acidimicrobiia bacterium]|jgi:Rrf2 family protein
MNITFSRRTDLALEAMRALLEAGGRLGRAELARSIGTTSSFLPQVMAGLVRGGWVVSRRGPGGGYELTESAHQARLLQVIEATEGPSASGRCVLRDAPCPGDISCPIHAIWVEARRVLDDGFDEVFVLQTELQGGN